MSSRSRSPMNPADTNYYYYVLNPETKQHEYSRTYAEHDALVQRYQMTEAMLR